MRPLIPYHRRHPVAIIRLFLWDLWYWFYAIFWKKRKVLPKELHSILLVNPNHLGDVVISTALLREIKEKLPQCRIDILVGQWAVPLIADHPAIRTTYCISHWRANRSNESLANKKSLYRQHVRRVSSQLKNSTYDAVFFLNAYEPSLIPLFKDAQWPLIGFASAGGGPLLTLKEEGGRIDEGHEIQFQAKLFEPWLGKVQNVHHYRPWVGNFSNQDPFILPNHSGQAYVVVHPGSGNPAKEWPNKSWLNVLKALQGEELLILITGHGKREAIQATQMLQQLESAKNIINLVNQLNLTQLIQIISGAVAVVCVDSVAGHIAASFNRPTLVITNGLSKVERWHPLGQFVTLFENKMLCSPCHNNPCAQRPCVTAIDPNSVIERLHQVLQK